MVQGGEQWERIATANARSNRQFFGFLAAATVLMGLVLLIFTRSILEPLTELGRAADRIGNGQYDAPPLAVCGSDELGRTAGPST